jgi:PAS domain S-box-containing protein
MNVYPLHASSGGAIVVCQDVTPSKRAELARERSEAHLNVAQKIASLGSWEWEVNADTMRWSDEQYRIFGYAPGSCRPTYAMFVQAVHPDDRNTFTLAIDTALAVKLPYNIECRIVRPDGSVRNTQCQGAVETGAGGQALRMAGTVIDITERTASAAELAQTHQKLLANQFAMERAGIGIAWTDFVTGRFIYVNKYFAELLGHPMDEMLSRSVSDIAPEFDLGAYEQLGVTLLKFGKATFETILVARDGRCMAVEVSVHYREGYGDLSPHHIAFITDISGRKETEQALIKAQVAEAATVAKSAFLANMSHEIRTPMNAIIGMTQLFRRGQLTQQQLSQLDQIDVSTEHLLDVINDILDLSKIEAGKFMLEDGGLVISALMERVSTIVLPHIHAKGLQLIVETEPLAVPLRGDMTRLSQALINFANNAVKFTNQGTVTIRARLVEETQDTQLMRFEVSDTGIGIAPEPLGRLFTAFEQGDSSTTRAYGGTGLGLAIAKRLAELMGGEAGAVSTVGAGSLFWFTARLTKSEVLQESPAAPMTPDEDAEAILLRDFTGKRLLIAEDDPVNQMVACMILEDTGLVIDIAEDGAQAVEKARQVAYDLIFMDLQMPKMDGVAATQSIRALPGYGEVPIIAFTANAFLEDRNRCLDAGMNDFVAKPMYPAMLCGMVLKWLRLRESHGLPA